MSTTTFRLKEVLLLPGKIPTTSQLELGEIAVNTYDGKAYIKKSVAGEESVVEIGAGDVGGQSMLNIIFQRTVEHNSQVQMTTGRLSHIRLRYLTYI